MRSVRLEPRSAEPAGDQAPRLPACADIAVAVADEGYVVSARRWASCWWPTDSPALPTSGDQTKMDIAIYFIPTR
jgi:hypothetical protein